MDHVIAARDVLLQGRPWTRGIKRSDWLRQRANDIGISFSAAWGIFYGRRKRLWAEEQALFAAYIQEISEIDPSRRELEAAYAELAARAEEIDRDGTRTTRPDASTSGCSAVPQGASEGSGVEAAPAPAAGQSSTGLGE